MDTMPSGYRQRKILILVGLGLFLFAVFAYNSGIIPHSGRLAIVTEQSTHDFESNVLPSGDECYVPDGMNVDGAAEANVLAWEDVNANGKLDSGEPPLGWVSFEIEYGDGLSITDHNGKGATYKFMPGCACRCWESEAVVVIVPLGYRATTPIRFDLSESNDVHMFGFHRDDTKRPGFEGEPEWAEAFANRGIRLMAFHYVEETSTLAVTLQDTPLDADQYYWDFFGLLYELETIVDEEIRQIAITVSGDTITCNLAKMKRASGRVSYSELLRKSCGHAAP